MNFHKSIKKYIFTIFLTSILSLIFIPSITPALKVYADGSMTDEDGRGSRKIVGGPTSDRTGWLFYMIDTNNNQVTETVAVA